MAFSSIAFLFFFLPVFLAAYFASGCRNGVLLAGSLLFYAWGDPPALPMLLVFIGMNWGLGLLAHRRAALRIGVALNLALLVWFKYLDFLVRQLDPLLPALHLRPIPVPGIALPLGISFFAFQGISYLVDVSRGTVAPQRRLLAFATYKAMFPPLIAGPIVRYSFVAGSLGPRRPNAEEIRRGILLFGTGLAQKVLLADTVAVPADRIFARPPAGLDAGTAWLGAALYALQIFFDFNGYTNMALGLGRMMGIGLPPNFDLPYRSRSVTEFWRRWHISLSSWFRDYLYIPMGGNRRGRARTAFNLLTVFLLCGFWHGAAWNFLAWGLWHGAFLALEREGLGAWLSRRTAAIRHAYLLAVVIAGWVPFRAAGLDRAARMLGAMAGVPASLALPADPSPLVTPSIAAAMAAGALFSVWRPDPRLLAQHPDGWPLAEAACAALVLLSAARLAAGTYSPFIYFRF